MDIEKIGKYLAKKRNEKKLTQDALSNILNVNPKTISKWENGRTAPDILLLTQIASALDTTVENILSGEESQEENREYKENNMIIDSILYYIKINRNKIILIMIIILTLLFASFTSYTIISKYKSYCVYNIETNSSDFNITGYLIYNNNKKILILNNLSYNDIYEGTDKEVNFNEIEVSILLGNEILFSKLYDSKTNDNLLKNVNINLNEKELSKINNKNYNDLKIQLKYKNTSDDEHIENIDFLFR